MGIISRICTKSSPFDPALYTRQAQKAIASGLSDLRDILLREHLSTLPARFSSGGSYTSAMGNLAVTTVCVDGRLATIVHSPHAQPF